MGVRLYPIAGYEELGKQLGMTPEEIEAYTLMEREDFEAENCPLSAQRLKSIRLNGFGKFSQALAKECGFDPEGGQTTDGEISARLLLTTLWYDPYQNDIFSWKEFFQRTGGVRWS